MNLSDIKKLCSPADLSAIALAKVEAGGEGGQGLL